MTTLDDSTLVQTVGPVRLELLPDGRYLIHIETPNPFAGQADLARRVAEQIKARQMHQPSPEESPQPHQP